MSSFSSPSVRTVRQANADQIKHNKSQTDRSAFCPLLAPASTEVNSAQFNCFLSVTLLKLFYYNNELNIFLEDWQTRHIYNKLQGRIFHSPCHMRSFASKIVVLLTWSGLRNCHYVTVDRNYICETITLMHINATEILYEYILLYLVEVP